MIKRSKKTLARNRIIQKLDAAARAACFERDGNECQRCHVKNREVQWCHIIGRRHKCIRWDLDNSLSMCAGCHMFWHEYPTLSGDWFRKNWPERHEHIMELYNKGGKVDLEALLEEMTTPPATPYLRMMEPIKDSEIPF